MGKTLLLLVVSVLLFASALSTPENFLQHNKMFQIWYENALVTDVLADPNFYAFSKQGQFLANYFALSHPSQPNYVGAIAGSTLGVITDNPISLHDRNIVDLLEAAGKTWKVYAENYPGNCFLGDNSSYVAKHNPFISFTNINTNPARCAKIVNAEEFAVDVAAGNIADYTWYIPNVLDDGHDTNISYAGIWTKGFLPPLLANPTFMEGMLIVLTYDEAEFINGSNGITNQIYTVLLGGPGVPVTVGLSDYTPYSHYSLLRTSEVNWNLGSLRKYDRIATPFLRFEQQCGDAVATGTEQCDPGYLSGSANAWLAYCCVQSTCQFAALNTSCGRNSDYTRGGCSLANLECGSDMRCDEVIFPLGQACTLPGGRAGQCTGANSTCYPVGNS